MESLAVEKIKSLNTCLLKTAFVFTDDIVDEKIGYLNPKYKITIKAISQHFIAQFKSQKK